MFPADRRTDSEMISFISSELEKISSGCDIEFVEAAAPLQLFRAALFLRRWRQRSLGSPLLLLSLLLRWLLWAACNQQTGPDATGPLGADRRPAADLSPPAVLLRARTILTAAPPARVPCQAGTTG